MGSGYEPQPSNANIELSGYAKEQLQHQKELEEREMQKKVKHIPAGYALFDVANYPGILKKLNEFNSTINTDDKIWKDLMQAIELLKMADVKRIETKHVAALDALLLQWPSDKVFPVVDLARLMILTDAGANYFFQQYQTTKRNILTELLNLSFGSNGSQALQVSFIICSIKLKRDRYYAYDSLLTCSSNRSSGS